MSTIHRYAPVTEPHDLPLVAIGAAQGGIAALRALFQALDDPADMAYLVMVRDEDAHAVGAALGEALALPVQVVEAPLTPTPGAIHVLPATAQPQFRGGRLDPGAAPDQLPYPLDALFAALADYPGECAALVLSGAGSDGALGLGAVAERGGLVLAQDPAEAEMPEMPQSALDGGQVQAALPVAALARQLDRWCPARRLVPPPRDDTGTLALRGIIEHLRHRTGHNFAGYDRDFLRRRLARRLAFHRLVDPADYLRLLRRDPDEIQPLLADLSIPVSGFFRDPAAWTALAERVIEPLLAETPPDRPLRFWVAGCATGEEAYSLAMLLAETAIRRRQWPGFQIFASDLNQQALAVARRGCYPAGIAGQLDATRLERFFQMEGRYYRVQEGLRQRVVFAHHDLLREPPYGKLDLVCCRNLLIYLDAPTRDRVLARLHYALKPGGALFLGQADPADTADFQVLDDSQRLLRALPRPSAVLSIPEVEIPTPGRRPATPPARPREQAHRQLLEQLAPPSVLLDAGLQVRHLSDNAGRYLRLGGGVPGQSILELVHPALRESLRVGLAQLAGEQRGWLGEPVSLELAGEPRRVMLQLCRREAHPPASLLLFLEGQPAPAAGASDADADTDTDGLRERLHGAEQARDELAGALIDTQQQRQDLEEQYRTVLEELDSNQEELNTLNEQLRMSNVHLKAQLDETAHHRDHLRNLINATEAGILFLDRRRRIQWFSPAIRRLFSLKPEDRDRPLTDFAHRLMVDNLDAEAARVLDDLEPREHELRDLDGAWWLLRLRPYRSGEDRIDGVVMSFVDITAHKQAELAWRHSEVLGRELAVVNRLHRMAMAMVNAASVDEALAETLGAAQALLHAERGCVQALEEDGTLRVVSCRGFAAQSATACKSGPLRELAERTLARGARLAVVDLAHHDQPLGRQTHEATGCRGALLTPLSGRHGSRHGLLSLYFRDPRPSRREDEQLLDLLVRQAGDVIERLHVEQRLQAAARHKDAFLGLLGHELRNPLAALVNGLNLLVALQPTDPTIQQTVAMLERQGRHMTRLVNDLLDITRIDQGKIQLHRKAVALNACVEEVVATLRAQLEAGELSLERALPEPSLVLDADPDRLAQVLDNLLGNAIKFTPPGGRITLSAEAGADQARIGLRDTGIGMETGQLEGIFDAFRQIQGEHQRRGLGLGLALVRSLVNLHGGEIHAHSQGPGQGSEFQLRWPLAEMPREATPAPAATADTDRRRILVVDDNADIADAFATLLRALGHEVMVAYNGETGLASAREHRPEVAFLDLGMPGMDGVQLAERLHESLGEDCPLLVAVTGHGQPADRERTRAAGFGHHLLKPVPMERAKEVLAAMGSERPL